MFNYKSDLDKAKMVYIIGKAEKNKITKYIDLNFAVCDATAYISPQYAYINQVVTKNGKVVKNDLLDIIPRPLRIGEVQLIQKGLQSIVENHILDVRSIKPT